MPTIAAPMGQEEKKVNEVQYDSEHKVLELAECKRKLRESVMSRQGVDDSVDGGVDDSAEQHLLADPTVGSRMRVFMVDILGKGIPRSGVQNWLSASRWNECWTDSGGCMVDTKCGWHLGRYCSENEWSDFVKDVSRQFYEYVASGAITFKRMKWELFCSAPLSESTED